MAMFITPRAVGPGSIGPGLSGAAIVDVSSGLGATFFDCSVVENGVHVGNREPPPGTACGWNYTLEESAESSLAGHAMQLAIRYGIAGWNDFNQGPLGNNKVAAWRQSGAEPYIRGDWINSLTGQGGIWDANFTQRVKAEHGHLTIDDWPGAKGATTVARPTSADILAANPGAFATPEQVRQAEANAAAASGAPIAGQNNMNKGESGKQTPQPGEADTSGISIFDRLKKDTDKVVSEASEATGLGTTALLLGAAALGAFFLFKGGSK